MNRSSIHPQSDPASSRVRRLVSRSVSPVGRLAVSTMAGLLTAIFVIVPTDLRAGPTYDASKHGHPETGVQRIDAEGPGACAQCHENHGSRNGIPNAGPFDVLLFRGNDAHLCYECHQSSGAEKVYHGSVIWSDSSHSRSPMAYWPGPVPAARKPSDAGKCVNCHDPHGADDATGTIPSMLHLREQTLCLGCHTGVQASDVKSDFSKPYRHPIAFSQRHSAAEASIQDPAHFAGGATNQRHAECADCHNAHVATSDLWPPAAPEASQRNFGVARVAVVNQAAGQLPTYVWRGAEDIAQPLEYELCFKCHSSWTTLPNGSPDLAQLTNPNNPSYHPIQAEGKNRNIDPMAFSDGWSWDRRVFCSDCHGSDEDGRRGPHGSMHRSLLKRPYPTASAPAPTTASDLCFSCHRHEVYADPTASTATQQASRFNDASGRGHTYHVAAQNIACSTCHATHGSVSNPALIASGGATGIILYSQGGGGGTCTTTCHEPRNYTVSYPR
ncbi:MAG TPA: cytochrome c3 family protein [Thermoanaerobaculia bacterium]